MPLTSITDTRRLIHLEFPTIQESTKTRLFFEHELRKHLFAPTIVLTEFIEGAGTKIDKEAAKNRLRALKEKGLEIVELGEKQALIAGELLLTHHNVPITDALVASYVKSGDAEYVLTDDPHYKMLNVKTKWIT
ncbi:PIN domain-containing protein [Candidatus Bathycorpusculum sp.]|jgi:predicted nucleic acid-binding protein|uniref:PIN domain-containing protein n=1 Tax=Candidatus Bathycorpusculum sp. TaxID=2994959 RepID=UPI00282DBD85|nr:PIN domain-containing protein [Candidatus Termitimicrobium sp.]MCL2686146.1 PIN domain-containing protein [Candidatus Termitimicrobium sp.]